MALFSGVPSGTTKKIRIPMDIYQYNYSSLSLNTERLPTHLRDGYPIHQMHYHGIGYDTSLMLVSQTFDDDSNPIPLGGFKFTIHFKRTDGTSGSQDMFTVDNNNLTRLAFKSSTTCIIDKEFYLRNIPNYETIELILVGITQVSVTKRGNESSLEVSIMDYPRESH